MAKTGVKEPNDVRPWHTSLPPAPTVWVPGPATGRRPATDDSGTARSSIADHLFSEQTTESPEALLAAARLEAEQIVQQAFAAAAQIQEEAGREGLTTGRAEGLAETDALRQQLRNLLLSLADAYRAFCLDQAPALASLAAEAAGRLMQEQLSLEPQRALTIVQQVLDQALASTDLRLHLHPDDRETVRSYLDSSDAMVPAELQIIADPSVERGGCRLETRHGEVDATLSGRLTRLAHALGEVG